MKEFIELTRFPEGRVLINPSNISSIYAGKKRDGQGANFIDITVIQETTSVDNYWEVTETMDEIIAMLKPAFFKNQALAQKVVSQAKMIRELQSAVESRNHEISELQEFIGQPVSDIINRYRQSCFDRISLEAQLMHVNALYDELKNDYNALRAEIKASQKK